MAISRGGAKRVTSSAAKRAVHIQLGLNDFVRTGMVNANLADAGAVDARPFRENLQATIKSLEGQVNASVGLCQYGAVIGSDGAITIVSTPFKPPQRPADALLDGASITGKSISTSAEAFYKQAVIIGFKGAAVGMTEDQIFKLPDGMTLTAMSDQDRLAVYASNVKAMTALQRIAGEFCDTETTFLNDMNMLNAMLVDFHDALSGLSRADGGEQYVEPASEIDRWRKSTKSIVDLGTQLGMVSAQKPSASVSSSSQYDKRHRNLDRIDLGVESIAAICEQPKYREYIATICELMALQAALNRLIQKGNTDPQIQNILDAINQNIEDKAKNLNSLIIGPVQRPPRVVMLFNEILKNYKGDQKLAVQRAFNVVKLEILHGNVLAGINDTQERIVDHYANRVKNYLASTKDEKLSVLVEKMLAEIRKQKSGADRLAYIEQIVLPVLLGSDKNSKLYGLADITKEWLENHKNSYARLMDIENALRDGGSVCA